MPRLSTTRGHLMSHIFCWAQGRAVASNDGSSQMTAGGSFELKEIPEGGDQSLQSPLPTPAATYTREELNYGRLQSLRERVRSS